MEGWKGINYTNRVKSYMKLSKHFKYSHGADVGIFIKQTLPDVNHRIIHVKWQ